MSHYADEPAHRHGDTRRTAIVLVNLGTPDAPTASALRRYLKQFLWDPRVVEIPRALWWLILHGIILNLRPAKSAAKYAKIWLKEGSPLRVHTERQAKLLKGLLGQWGYPAIEVTWAMRYGEPSIGHTLDQLKRQGVERVLIFPLYPQYAASTTASVMDDVADWVKHIRNPPELRFIKQYPDHPGYIAALAASVREHWTMHGRGERLVISFHGLPRRSLLLGDPYFCLCQKTGRLLAEALQLSTDDYLITFQSRFGKAKWLEPYTQPTLEKLARDNVARVDVICPGFVADCLETLEEIALECKTAYLSSGGKIFSYIPCMNERADWIAALGDIATTHLAGWPLSAETEAASSARAKQLGATN
ncbi:ferrochelatase [Rugosibacter aromaticivorans]|uniref:Ferrochelatase n=1 Tax=Rugosibacter aromaticivorans TaxID=1565605 RepID=A0A0C5JAG4_9PROT|nr:ferrochelatase [Rugosibacter aromaticivorans]AJP48915.1 ferrochelatase [Rugosibacter aromaticivorans]TBR14659.1 MAG: ferrochelatase [Rugosibacter sp.]